MANLGTTTIYGDLTITGALNTAENITPIFNGGLITEPLTTSAPIFDNRITTGNKQLINGESTVIYVGNPSTKLQLESSTNPSIKVGLVNSYYLYHEGYKPTPATIGAATTIHSHTEYATTSHSHSNYAATAHVHSNYSATGHVHTAAEISGLPTSLPANGGNSDTVDGLHGYQLGTLNAVGSPHGTAYPAYMKHNAKGDSRFFLGVSGHETSVNHAYNAEKLGGNPVSNFVKTTGGSMRSLMLTDYGTPFECSQYIDFHEVGSNVDYNTRLYASGNQFVVADRNGSLVINAEINNLKSTVVSGKQSVANAINGKTGLKLTNQSSFAEMATAISTIKAVTNLDAIMLRCFSASVADLHSTSEYIQGERFYDFSAYPYLSTEGSIRGPGVTFLGTNGLRKNLYKLVNASRVECTIRPNSTTVCVLYRASAPYWFAGF